MRKGVRCDVLRNAHHAARGVDPTAGGVTTRATEVLLVGEGVPELEAPGEGMPVLELCYIDFGERTWFAAPIGEDGTVRRGQYGGNYILAGGGRSASNRLPYEARHSGVPLRVHDRFETPLT